RTARLHGDDAELALDEALVGHLDDLLHADELAKLLDDLLDDRVAAARREHDLRKRRVGRHVDRERVDVEAAPREERDDARELPKAVFDQDREDVSSFHAKSLGSGGSLSGSGSITIS